MERNHTNHQPHNETGSTSDAPTTEANAETAQNGAEALPKMQPKIYAACLAAYNNGFLHGEWIYADQEPDYLQAEITDMLETSPTQPAEEWAIHDYEDFGAFNVHEYERLDTIARVAGGLALHGPAFAHWIHEVGTDTENAIETFTNTHRGTYDTYQDLATEWLDDLGLDLTELLPNWLLNRISVDYDGLGRDLAADYIAIEDHDGIHLFEAP